MNDKESFYSAQEADWQKQFAIIRPSTRHGQLKRLVHHIFRQVGHGIARANADAQYLAARMQPKAMLAEHLEEFEELWNWTTEQFIDSRANVRQVDFNALFWQPEPFDFQDRAVVAQNA